MPAGSKGCRACRSFPGPSLECSTFFFFQGHILTNIPSPTHPTDTNADLGGYARPASPEAGYCAPWNRHIVCIRSCQPGAAQTVILAPSSHRKLCFFRPRTHPKKCHPKFHSRGARGACERGSQWPEYHRSSVLDLTGSRPGRRGLRAYLVCTPFHSCARHVPHMFSGARDRPRGEGGGGPRVGHGREESHEACARHKVGPCLRDACQGGLSHPHAFSRRAEQCTLRASAPTGQASQHLSDM